MEHLTDLPVWLRLTHLFNFFFIILMIRSGIQILADHPKLYWNDHSTPGSEWLKFGKKKNPKGQHWTEDKHWTSKDEEIVPLKGIALPGGKHNIGPGRRWHFLVALSWMVNGFIYVALLFATGMWRRLIPTDLSIFPRAWETFVSYLHFQVPPPEMFTPFDPLQQIAYAVIIFVIAPLLILTALAMSPAVIGRWPWYAKMFGGRQAARSIHFLSMSSIVAFLVIHVILVFTVHYPATTNSMVFGTPEGNATLGTLIVIGVVLAVFAFNIWITVSTIHNERGFQLMVDRILNPVEQTLLGRLPSRQKYTEKDISPYFRVNGNPPETEEYRTLLQNDFENWNLSIRGLVDNTLSLSLEDLKDMERVEVISKHNCIQGWSAVAGWAGTSIKSIMDKAGVQKKARYVVFVGFDLDEEGHPYHESLRIREALMPQTFLAYEMNGVTLPIEHGAPLRLRAESRLGFKMVKYLKEILFVESLEDAAAELGGTHEKLDHFDDTAAI